STTISAYYFDTTGVRQNLTITNGSVTLPAGVASFFVSVPTASDTDYEGAERFTLTASLANGNSASDTATILDDGSGKIYTHDGVIDPAGVPDDDRTIAVVG
ncbi:MAG: hypothetical protein ACK55I_42165, partial [bacterium]